MWNVTLYNGEVFYICADTGNEAMNIVMKNHNVLYEDIKRVETVKH